MCKNCILLYYEIKILTQNLAQNVLPIIAIYEMCDSVVCTIAINEPGHDVDQGCPGDPLSAVYQRVDPYGFVIAPWLW